MVGEIVNRWTDAVYFVHISARYYYDDDQLVATADGYAMLTRTDPGQRNPFRVILSNAPSTVARYELTLTWSTSGILDYQAATVLSRHTRENDGVEVFGEVRNDRAREMCSVEVAVTFYDDAGNVVDTDSAYASATTLAPGATSIYQINPLTHDLAFAGYEVQAQGYLVPVSEPPPPVASVHVRSERSYVQGLRRYVVGEVLNDSTIPAYDLEVMARFYDASDQLVAVQDAYSELSATRPDQRNPFNLVLWNAPATIAHYQLSLSWRTSTILDYQPITVLSKQIRDNYGVEVFGEVRNDQASEMRSVKVAVTFYDSGGEVVDIDSGYGSVTTLAPGATTAYRVSTFNSSLVFASYEVQAEGYVAP